MGKKRRGHFCFGCERYLANEKFSGKEHQKHFCRKCEKLSKNKLSKELNTIFESDEYFAYIAGYTDGGAPYSITYEEWDELERIEGNRIPWSFKDEDRNKDYQKSINDLLKKIDQMLKDTAE